MDYTICAHISPLYLLYDNNHIDCLNRYANQIADACIRSADSTIPCTKRRGSRGNILGWTEIVAPASKASIFWHNMWIACGRPHTGIVSDIMRKRDCNIMRQLELQENKSQTLLTVVLLLRYVKIDLVIFGVRRNGYAASAVALVVLLMA